MTFLTGCHWPEQEIQPFYIKETFVIKFYNNGDSSLDRMAWSGTMYFPVEDRWMGWSESKEKNPSMFQKQLNPYDSITSYTGDVYIGCTRYFELAVYYADSTSEDSYRLRGKYIIDDTIQQKYAKKEYKYPDKMTIVVNWPEDSLLFKLTK